LCINGVWSGGSEGNYVITHFDGKEIFGVWKIKMEENMFREKSVTGMEL